MLYDALIIGGGPAGLTVALTLARQLHTSVILDSQEYRNARSNKVHMVLSWDHKDLAAFRQAAVENIQERYNTVQVAKTKIKSIYRHSGPDNAYSFTASDDTGLEWRGRKLVFATGVRDVFPAIEGYDECWAYGIFHCLFCHGYEERQGKSAGVLAIDDIGAVGPALHLARNVLQLMPEVVIYTCGSEELALELMDKIKNSRSNKLPPMVVDSRTIVRLERGKATKSEVILHFKDGGTATESFLAHKPQSVSAAAELATQLGIEMTPQGDLKADAPFFETTVKGVFVAGDSNPTMKFVNSSMFTGGTVGSALAAQVQQERWGQGKTLK